MPAFAVSGPRSIPCNPGDGLDDGARETNCLHAALVELKDSGAADFWMKGEATIPLSAIVPSGCGGGKAW